MINVSNEFKYYMQENTEFNEIAEITLANNEKILLEAQNFTVSNNNIIDGANANSLPLGEAISRTIQIEIANYDDEYSDVDFFGAKIRLLVEYYIEEIHSIERVEKGVFTVITPETYGSTIIISAMDDMYKADRDYTTNLVFPTTIGNMFIEACNLLSIPYQTSNFRNHTFMVNKAPTDITFRQLFGYIAMLAGGNARINIQGKLEILSYDKSALATIDGYVSGGSFKTKTTPYSDGENINGGTFTYNDGASLDGGSFTSGWDVPTILNSWSDLRVDTDDVVITGVGTKWTDSDNVEHQSLFGTSGYILEIENQLIAGNEVEAVNLIGNMLVGMKFRVFDGELTANPLLEFMDVVCVADRKGNVYPSIITDVEFNFFGFTYVKNSAVSAIRNSSKMYSESTKTIVEARKLVEQEMTARETAVKNLQQQLANSNGLYETTVPQADGSLIYYMHDKPKLEQSKVVWKLTANAFGISTDGGNTYPYGLDAGGVAILERIYAIGINADYIQGGTLVLGGSKVATQNGSIIVYDENNKLLSKLNRYGFSAQSSDYKEAYYYPRYFENNGFTYPYSNSDYVASYVIHFEKKGWHRVFVEFGDFTGWNSPSAISDGLSAGILQEVNNGHVVYNDITSYIFEGDELAITVSGMGNADKWLEISSLYPHEKPSLFFRDVRKIYCYDCGITEVTVSSGGKGSGETTKLKYQYHTDKIPCGDGGMKIDSAKSMIKANSFSITKDNISFYAINPREETESEECKKYKMVIDESGITCQSIDFDSNNNMIFHDYLKLDSSLLDSGIKLRDESDQITCAFTNNAIIHKPTLSKPTISQGTAIRLNGYGELVPFNSSSKRYKEDITTELGKDLDPHKLYDIDVVQYKYKKGYLAEDDPHCGQDVIGFIAEDVAEKYPSACIYQDGVPEMWEVNVLFPALVKLVQEQHKDIEILKDKLAKLEKEVR